MVLGVIDIWIHRLCIRTMVLIMVLTSCIKSCCSHLCCEQKHLPTPRQSSQLHAIIWEYQTHHTNLTCCALDHNRVHLPDHSNQNTNCIITLSCLSITCRNRILPHLISGMPLRGVDDGFVYAYIVLAVTASDVQVLLYHGEFSVDDLAHHFARLVHNDISVLPGAGERNGYWCGPESNVLFVCFVWYPFVKVL